MALVHNCILLVIMLYIITLVFSATQPAFDATGANNHALGGWASNAHDEILSNRAITVILVVIALFVGFILPVFSKEDATETFRRVR